MIVIIVYFRFKCNDKWQILATPVLNCSSSAHCRFVSWQLESWKWHWNQPVRLKRSIFTITERDVSSPQWPFFRSVRTKERQRQKQTVAVLWWPISSVFFVLMLMQSERIHVYVCCAHDRIFSSLLPPFFLFFLSFSFCFKCVISHLLSDRVTCVYRPRLRHAARNLLQQAASLDNKNTKHKEMDLLYVTQ